MAKVQRILPRGSLGMFIFDTSPTVVANCQAEYDEVKVEESGVPRWEHNELYKRLNISQEKLWIQTKVTFAEA